MEFLTLDLNILQEYMEYMIEDFQFYSYRTVSSYTLF